MMTLVKLPFKLITFPIVAVLRIICTAAKAVTRLSCYIIGPAMLLVGIILAVMLFQGRWLDAGICGAVEILCLAALFGTAWLVSNMEGINERLTAFLHS